MSPEEHDALILNCLHAIVSVEAKPQPDMDAGGDKAYRARDGLLFWVEPSGHIYTTKNELARRGR